MREALGAGSLLLAIAACSVTPTTFTPIGAGNTGNDGGTDSSLDGGTDGSSNAAPGQAIWARSLSAMSAYRARLGPAGLVIAGSFAATTTLNTTFSPAGGSDMVFARLDPATGAIIASHHDGDAGYEAAFVDTLDATGFPILHGITSDVCNLGTGPLPGGGGSDTFIGRYATATPSWLKRIATPEEDKIIATAPGPNNTVLATGYFVGNVTIDGTQLTGRGNRDGMLVAFDLTSGVLRSQLVFGDMGRDEGGSVIATADGTILGGMFETTIKLGATTLTGAGATDAFVAKLGAANQFAWATRIGGAGMEYSPLVGVDSAGDVYASGTFQGEIVLDSAHSLMSNGSDDVYVIKLSGNDGHVLWARAIGSSGSDNVLGFAVSPSGRLAIAGNAAGVLNLGGDNHGGLDAFVASFETDGTLRWKHLYGSVGDDRGWSVSYGSDGMLYATLTLAGAVDVGAPIDGQANPIGVVLKLAP